MMDVMPRRARMAADALLTFDQACRKAPFLRSLTPAQLDRLRPQARIRRLDPGGAVWTLDEPTHDFTFLVEGHVKLFRRREDGRDVILDIRGPGDLLCAGAVSACAPYCCAAKAVSADVVAVEVRRQDVQAILEECPPAAATFLRDAAAHEMRLTDRIVELSSGQVDQRIAAVLLRLADQLGVPSVRHEVRIPIKLSRQDLADLCGTTLESAIRTMTAFARDRAVTTLPTGFLVSNRGYLETLAHGQLRSR
jgi:CRP/FNR family transcriptional regulator